MLLPWKIIGASLRNRKSPGTERRNARSPGGARVAGPRPWLYGAHAVRAALLNPRRRAWRLLATREAARRLDDELLARLRERGLRTEGVDRRALEAVLPAGAVHQCLALEVSPLDQPDLEDVIDGLESAPAAGRQIIVALDQITDPQNAGAVLRSAAAFGAAAVIVPTHGRAPESGTLAKAASGALDVVPYIDAGNLARALGALKAEGFWVLGLAAGGAVPLAEAAPGARVVLVLGAEGTGLRRLVREACDLLVRLPTRPPIDQLNVSNAAAVALYELSGRGSG